MSKHLFSHKKKLNPEGLKTACVIRYGAIGDLVQAMSLVTQLKRDGYHVTLVAQHPGTEAVKHDPNIDHFVVQTQNQVPISQLGFFWKWFEERGAPGEKKFDKWVNLTESVESNLLIQPGNIKFVWNPKARAAYMSGHNYLAFQHLIGDVPYNPSFKFYPTEEERRWREQERERMKKAGIEKYIFWCLAGSSRTHKVYPHSAVLWNHVLEYYPNWGVMTIGDPTCYEFEKSHEGKPRMWLTSRTYTLRQAFTMMETADVVFAPETGLASAAAWYDMPKVISLSHSSIENLTRDWRNTSSIYSPRTTCPGRGSVPGEVLNCNLMLPAFEGCRRSEVTGVAQCVTDTKPEWVWEMLQVCMKTGRAPKWEPPSE